MQDVVEDICGSTVQHGDFNNRVYLMRLRTAAVDEIVPALDRLANARGYEKIIAKIPEAAWDAFHAAGYVVEARIPGFFDGRSAALFAAKYIVPRRGRLRRSDAGRIRPVRGRSSPPAGSQGPSSAPGSLKACTPDDAEAMGALFGSTFASYPFPIHDPGYLIQRMASDVLYFAITVNDRLASVAAAEVDRRHRTAEMTDFATLPQWRGAGMAGRLLAGLDAAVSRCQVKTGFSIARAGSVGMQRILSNNGYRYAGFLKNNTQIGGRIESMTVWYKPLD